MDEKMVGNFASLLLDIDIDIDIEIDIENVKLLTVTGACVLQFD
jgi:hypothetical protein